MNEKSLSDFWSECEILSKLRPYIHIVQFFGVCLNPLCLLTEFLPNGNIQFQSIFYFWTELNLLDFIMFLIDLIWLRFDWRRKWEFKLNLIGYKFKSIVQLPNLLNSFDKTMQSWFVELRFQFKKSSHSRFDFEMVQR